MMKKFHNTDDVERFAMANCAMILNRAENRLSGPGRIFKCRTCHRDFETFQALGGHTASHKRPKLGVGDIETDKQLVMKAHKCSVCKQEFWTGQALGGHMRRHRTAKISLFSSNNGSNNANDCSTITTSDDRSDDLKMIKSNFDSTRILGLDLNLSPGTNELKIFEF
ncbi:Zinc finger protein 1 [Heracleum sosnowskyi]|uniref:Zinc finger protein 1 n=1 Tax=Heracleum sosnowskyi TaxID=360622 RepID=A0AAD8J6B9_9APIA|nr:Zinc finger protein 1 [Heracleum sosnowskyi]